MRCLTPDCARTAYAKRLCKTCYERKRNQAHRQVTREDEGYRSKGLRWTAGEFERVVAETPASAWKLMFWQDVSIRSGRPYFGVIQYARRHGIQPKVDVTLREAGRYGTFRELGDDDDDDDE